MTARRNAPRASYYRSGMSCRGSVEPLPRFKKSANRAKRSKKWLRSVKHKCRTAKSAKVCYELATTLCIAGLTVDRVRLFVRRNKNLSLRAGRKLRRQLLADAIQGKLDVNKRTAMIRWKTSNRLSKVVASSLRTFMRRRSKIRKGVHKKIRAELQPQKMKKSRDGTTSNTTNKRLLVFRPANAPVLKVIDIVPFAAREVCPHCKSCIDRSERKLCCRRGECIITEEMIPEWPVEYVELLLLTRDIGEVSRELNNLCNFSSIGTAHTKATRGFVYRVDNIPSMYGLDGRTFHRFHGPVEGAYYTHHARPSKFVSHDVVDEFRAYMLAYNALGRELRFINDQVTSYEEIDIRAGDEPLNANESYALMSNNSRWLEPPTLAGVVLPLASEDSVFVDTRSSLFESAQYPLLFPTGWGGFYDGAKRLQFASGLYVNSVAEFVKYSLYQNVHQYCFMTSLTQQYWLDQFSRWQEMTFAAMCSMPDVLSGYEQRIQKYSELASSRKGPKKGFRPFMIPARKILWKKRMVGG